jgi:hypothetical protein
MGGVGIDEIAKKLLCFGADGVTVFQGLKVGVTKQLQTKYAPFMTGMHCFVHRVNLAAKTLLAIMFFQNSEKLMQRVHAFSIGVQSNCLSSKN